jgi:hypothetical protein
MSPNPHTMTAADMTTRDSDALAYIGAQGIATAHTMRCATVGRYERLRNGVGRGQCPNLTESTYGHVMQQIEARRLFECKLCKRQRQAEAKRFRTADGTEATPIEGDHLQWLVRRSPRTWWVIGLHTRETQISEIDLNDMSHGTPWGIVATASRMLAGDIPTGESHPGPGWYYEYGGSVSDTPYRRMGDAIAGLLLSLAARRTGRAEFGDHDANGLAHYAGVHY